jgi:hypothetical protein
MPSSPFHQQNTPADGRRRRRRAAAAEERILREAAAFFFFALPLMPAILLPADYLCIFQPFSFLSAPPDAAARDFAFGACRAAIFRRAIFADASFD